MASTASSFSASSSTSSDETHRAEAGPLPVKRGEIGYLQTPENIHRIETDRVDELALPARHPADREPPPSATATIPLTPAATHAPGSPRTPIPDSPNAPPKATTRRIWDKVVFAGFHLRTLVLFLTQFLFFAATIAGWAVAIIRISKESSVNTAILFVHIAFAACLIVQFVFLERRIFRLRAERYSFIHPGEVLPTSRRLLGTSAPHIAFSPWNRPPLPTYAATLAQSGVGTGDVEDHLIAAPPPPAYGNTRGSRVLLTGYLRDSLRAQRPISQHSQMTQRNDESDRPLSYVSRDQQWDEIRDAERARRLDETLGTLERPTTRS